MIYLADRIVRDARRAYDENADGRVFAGGSFLSADDGVAYSDDEEPRSGSAERDGDSLTLDSLLRSKILEAVRETHSAAPLRLLGEGRRFGGSLYWNGDGSGWTPLPDDFLRLVSFRMSDWTRGVTAAIAEEDPQYALQSSACKGVRGNWQKPVCAIVNRQEGKALEFYSCKDETASVRRASYIPWPSFDAYGGVEISEKCYPASVYALCALLALSLGDDAKAQRMEALFNSRLT